MGKAKSLLTYVVFNIEDIFSCALLAVMSTFAFLNVLSRYVINLSLNFTDELNIYFFVWLTLAGTALAFRKGTHMCITVLYDRLPQKLRLVAFVLIQAVVLSFFAVLCYYGVLEVQDEMDLGAVTEALQLPLWMFTIGVPIGSFWIIIKVLHKGYHDLTSGEYMGQGDYDA